MPDGNLELELWCRVLSKAMLSIAAEMQCKLITEVWTVTCNALRAAMPKPLGG